MSTAHKEMPGTGVLFWEDESLRRSDKAPDFKGFITLEFDYKAGDKLKIGGWQKQTSSGKTLISLREDNWAKKKAQEAGTDQPYEVKPAYMRKKDDDLPF